MEPRAYPPAERRTSRQPPGDYPGVAVGCCLTSTLLGELRLWRATTVCCFDLRLYSTTHTCVDQQARGPGPAARRKRRRRPSSTGRDCGKRTTGPPASWLGLSGPPVPGLIEGMRTLLQCVPLRFQVVERRADEDTEGSDRLCHCQCSGVCPQREIILSTAAVMCKHSSPTPTCPPAAVGAGSAGGSNGHLV